MLDHTDTRLLTALQKDAHLTASELSELLNLSASQTSRRRQRLEADGYIKGYAAQLDPSKLGLTVQGFVQVHLSQHGPEQGGSFARLINQRPEIISDNPLQLIGGLTHRIHRGQDFVRVSVL